MVFEFEALQANSTMVRLNDNPPKTIIFTKRDKSLGLGIRVNLTTITIHPRKKNNYNCNSNLC